MRIPRDPPKMSGFSGSITKDPERLVEFFGMAVPEKYYHWDKLRHLEPPEGFSSEEWWTSIKVRRISNYRQIPLKDMKDGYFQYLVPDSVSGSLHNIDLRTGGNIGMPEQITNQQTRDQYYIKSLIQEAITSSQLEGAATTREVAKEMIQSGREPRDKSERMILNNYLTMRHLSTVKDQELSVELIFEIHRKVTEGILDRDDAAGRFRYNDEDIRVHDEEDSQVLHTPPNADELHDRLIALCRFVNDVDSKPFLHPVLRAIIAHFWLAYDHPFYDGNGRTARALFYWCMLRYGYWLFEFISISSILKEAPKSYARSFLYTETDDNDLTYFIIYQIEVIERAIKALSDYIERKSSEMRAFQSQLRSFSMFNYRQQSLLGHALKHPYHEYSIESHQSSHNVTYQTARTDLLDLAKRGLLSKRKMGRKFIFSVPSDLNSCLNECSEQVDST